MDRNTDSLFSYCRELVSTEGQDLSSGEIMIMVLTDNDDSGRHGVLVPLEAHDFFPEIVIADANVNATTGFDGRDCLSHGLRGLKYKYYQRYPERRITCLNPAFSDHSHGLRVGIFLRATHRDGTSGYYVDLIRQQVDAEFEHLCRMFFGAALPVREGLFLQRQVDSPAFEYDGALSEFIGLFDDIAKRGYIKSLRPGDTGRRINLFQRAPTWNAKSTGIERLRVLGRPDTEGRYSCYSQVSGTTNNLGLKLRTDLSDEQIDLLRNNVPFGYWSHPTLAKRLSEKHSRAVFVKAHVRTSGGQQSFHYKEIVYCEKPSINRFVDLVDSRRIVFEFTMSERENGTVRNHGYPWRLTHEDWLSELFSLRVKLR